MPSRITWLLAVALTSLSHGQNPDPPEDGVPHSIAWKDGTTLSGEVLGFERGGSVKLLTPYSGDPLVIPIEQLREIHFRDHAPAPDLAFDRASTRLQLSTGETFPGEIVKLSDDALTLETEWAGTLQIPRPWLSHADFNLVRQKLVYSGPTPDDDWLGEELWEQTDGAFDNAGGKSISLDVPLPDRFVLSCEIAWEQTPHLQIGFFLADPSHEAPADHYELVLSQRGFELRRFMPGRNQPIVLGTSYRVPAQFDDSSIDLELRVDRQTRRFYLAIDGTEEAVFHDPTSDTAPAPGGTHLMLLGSTDERSHTRIGNIRVHEWDSKTFRQRREGRGSGTKDVIIDITGSRFSGVAQSIAPSTDEGFAMTFQPLGVEDPVQVPLTRISRLFFSETARGEDHTSSYTITLNDRGSLEAAAIELAGDDLKVQHPFLGGLTIPLSSVQNVSVTKDENEN